MGDFNPNPFKGEASIPHVPEEIFSTLWLGWQAGLTFMMLPGRIMGLHLQHNRINRDYAIACCNEAAQAKAVRKGRIPTLALPKPSPTTDSWPRMWAKHLHWQAWKLDRLGGGQGVRPV